MPHADDHPLHRLAQRCGIVTGYHDVSGNQVEAQTEVLLLVLRAFGIPIRDPEDAPRQLEELNKREAGRLVEPVHVISPGSTPHIPIRLSPGAGEERFEIHLEKENGENMEGFIDAGESLDGTGLVLSLPWTLESGYHRLALKGRAGSHSTRLICSSGRAHGPRPRGAWGLLAPLYALHRRSGWGTGDYSLLNELLQWVGQLGGDVAATLPLLPLAPGSANNPSPYNPWSRLFWNEMYLNLEGIPELKSCQEAGKILSSPTFQSRLKKVQGDTLVDYGEIQSLKAAVLGPMFKDFLAREGPRQDTFQKYVRETPLLADYARSRAGEITGLDPGLAESYHAYVQWLCENQLGDAAQAARRSGTALALDYPLGVCGQGFDCRQFPRIFTQGVSAGAPPDPFFTGGQNWGFPPYHPQKIRQEGYEYFARTLRHQFRYANLLRVDHIMGFHRLFWVPEGVEAPQGVYVNYSAEEFYAVLALESQRHRAWVLGEDLGTVPPEVRPAMARHGLLRCFVAQFEELSDPEAMKGLIPEDSVASLNTHDMPPFAAYWGTRPQPAEALKRHLRMLGQSPAALVLLNLEDLWLETQAQNVPGTIHEHPNWKKKFRYSWEQIQNDPEIRRLIRELHDVRKKH